MLLVYIDTVSRFLVFMTFTRGIMMFLMTLQKILFLRFIWPQILSLILQQLIGNRNSGALRKNKLDPVIRSQTIRIYPKDPFSMLLDTTNSSCLKLELHGCSAPGIFLCVDDLLWQKR